MEFGISMLTERLGGVTQRPDSFATKQTESVGEPGAKSFSQTLNEAISGVNESMKQADEVSRKFASGEATSLHEVMIAMEKADISLRTMTAVRSKLVEAYQEIMRMQV